MEAEGAYKGIVVNLFNQAISTYSEWEFNSICNFNGVCLGATDTGIHVLGGDTDNGTHIDARIYSGSMDFGDTFIKYLRNIWITHRTKGKLEFTAYADENPSTRNMVKQTSHISETIKEERVKVPRGLKGRFYTVKLKNRNGADFDIDSLSLLVESIQRKRR